jgi:predicted O-methyltransferase YrrM
MSAVTDIRSQWRLALQAERDARQDAWSDIQGHLPFLYDSVCRFPGARVLELGIRSGTSTGVLLAAVEQADGHLWSVDLEEPRVPSWWPLTGRWTLTVGDDLDAEIITGQPTGVDLLLLDTSHAYQHTLDELRAYVPRVKPGGLVCCHDTLLVGHDARGMGIEGDGGEVWRALDAYCAETGLTWSNREGSYGMGVIEVPT